MRGADRIIVALDVPGPDEARALIGVLGDSVGVYKIGLELLFAGGLDLARDLAAEGKAVFLDAKLLDIETTVERAVANVARLGVRFLTVHASDPKTAAAAVEGRGVSELKLLGVTVLTNLTDADLAGQGIGLTTSDLVLRRAQIAKEAGFDGVIASGREAARLRTGFGARLMIVTPGIRLAGAATQDQARVTTPKDAVQAGADYLVVGRPITRAPDPRAAARAIAAEIEAAVVSGGPHPVAKGPRR